MKWIEIKLQKCDDAECVSTEKNEDWERDGWGREGECMGKRQQSHRVPKQCIVIMYLILNERDSLIDKCLNSSSL